MVARDEQIEPLPSEDEAPSFEPLNEFEAFVEGRRQTIDAMIWQVPGLCITAQAFLYIVALNPNASNWVRVFAGSLAIAAGLATIQLLVKHRYHEETYAETVDVSRRARDAEPFRGLGWFKKIALEGSEAVERDEKEAQSYVARYHDGAWRRRLSQSSSVGVWIATLFLFVVADALIIIGAVLDARGVFQPFG